MVSAIRKDKPPTFIQQQAFLGSLLGDGSIAARRTATYNCSFSITHSAKQQNYLEWKYKLLLPFSRPIRLSKQIDQKSGRVKESYRFQTISHYYFTALRQLTYDGKKKTVTAEWLNNIRHPIALAILIGDDGRGHHLSQGRVCGIEIATNAFSEDENRLIAFWLQATFGLTTAKVLTKKAGYSYIVLAAKDMPRLRALILPYLPEVVSYKVGGNNWEQCKRWVGKIKTACGRCGKPIEDYASNKRRFCSCLCANRDKVA